MPTGWTLEALAAKGWDPDGRRYPARLPITPAGRGGEPTRGDAKADSQNARAAATAVNAGAGPIGSDAGNAREPHRLSTAALRRLTPEQRLQIEVVQLYRPLLRPDARLLGINGELPGGGRLQALRAAVRREMGYQRGCADMLARRPGHLLWLEAKVETDQSHDQALFAAWAHGIGDGYAVFTSVEDCGVLLKIHGMLR